MESAESFYKGCWKMSRLDELIRELCPNGVEYKTLGDAVSIERGKRLVRDQLSADFGSGYPVFQNSMTPLGYHTDYNYPENTAFIIGAGAAGEIGFSAVKFWAADDCYPMVCGEDISSRYLYHALLRLQPQIKSRVRKASIPRLSRTAIENFQIPVPPLPVQEEIVRILDNFTALTAELTAREKQYEFYRDKLLSMSNELCAMCNVELSDIVRIKNGKDYKHLADGNIPVYGSGGIMTYVNEYCYDKPSVLIPRKGSLNNLFYVDTPFWNVDTIFYTEIDESKIVPKYLFYLLQKEHLENLNTAGGVPSLTQAVLNKIKLTLPPLDVQNRLVNVLDNFDAICSDLKIGLPAEIEARQKQYEFYRDALLTYAATGKTILRQTDRQTDR